MHNATFILFAHQKGLRRWMMNLRQGILLMFIRLLEMMIVGRSEGCREVVVLAIESCQHF